MANTYIKGANGGESINPAGTEGLPLDDGSTSTWAQINNLFDGAPAQGEVIYFNGTKWKRLGVGTSGQFLQTQGAAANPQWATPLHSICEARLTLTSGTPITTADVTGATNLYIAPFKGNRIGLYDGSANWNVRSFTEITIALGTLTSGLPYDVFVYDNAGTVTARSPVAWTNATTRATALTTQNGILVKTGATTDRYLGTFYTTATTTTEDSLAKRFVWNYYNRVLRPMRVIEATNSWTYTTAAFRAMNNSTSNALQTVIGWSEDAFNAQVLATCAPSAGNPYRVVGIGVGSTTVNSAQMIAGVITGGKESTTAFYKAIPAVGYQYYQALEYSEASGTVTWYGDDGGSIISSGIMGEVLA